MEEKTRAAAARSSLSPGSKVLDVNRIEKDEMARIRSLLNTSSEPSPPPHKPPSKKSKHTQMRLAREEMRRSTEEATTNPPLFRLSAGDFEGMWTEAKPEHF